MADGKYQKTYVVGSVDRENTVHYICNILLTNDTILLQYTVPI
jgi:hypothetical protein